MQAVYVQKGDAIDYTPAADVDAGEVVKLGSLLGVAATPIPADTLGAIAVEGVFDVAKAAGAITAGAKVYWDATAEAATTTATGNTAMGLATADAADAAATVRVKLTPGA